MINTSGDEAQIDWSAVFRQMPASCMVLDAELRIVTASGLYLDTVGRSLDEIRGQHVFDAFPEQPGSVELFRDAFLRALAGEANTIADALYRVPLLDAADLPSGDLREVYWTCHHAPLLGSDGTIDYVIQHATDVTERVRARQLKDAIAGELQHRSRNLLTLVTAIAKRTAASSEDMAAFVSKFEARIVALAHTHSHLTGDNWDGITLDRIVAREVGEYGDAGGRIVASGDPILLNSAEAQIMTLVIHELTTNSVKHGVLNGDFGNLRIAWAASADGGYSFEWREGGIAIDPAPARKGFGSFILDTVAPAQLQGSAKREFSSDAFLYSLAVTDRPSVSGEH